jgi:hypothetical protein
MLRLTNMILESEVACERDLTISILKSELEEFSKGIWDSITTYSKDLIFNSFSFKIFKSFQMLIVRISNFRIFLNQRKNALEISPFSSN